jgi:hypothetical protein
MLESRELSISTICQIASILNDDNKQAILERAKGRSRREVELVAREFRPPVELRDRMVPVRATTPDGVQNMVFIQFLAPDEYAQIFDDVRNLMPGDAGYGEVSLGSSVSIAIVTARLLARSVASRKGSASLHSHR